MLQTETPSAAAELVVPDKKDILGYIESIQRRLALTMENKISKQQAALNTTAQNLAKYHPERVWQGYQQRFDLATMQMSNFSKVFEHKKQVFENYAQRIQTVFETKFTHFRFRAKEDLTQISYRLLKCQELRIAAMTTSFEQTATKFEQLSPHTIMKKGYAVIQKDGKVMKSAKSFKPSDSISISLMDGNLEGTINKIEILNDNEL